MLECKRCLDLHGPGCTATHETADGEPACVFCVDGVLCPVQQRRAKSENARATAGAMTRIATFTRKRPRDRAHDSKGEQPMEPNSAEPAVDRVPICRRPGCTTKLGPRNRSGLCARHCHWGESKTSRSNGAHTQPAASSADGDRAVIVRDRPGADHPAPGSTGSNGHAQGTEIAVSQAKTIVEDRVDRLLLSLPLVDKTRLARAWLDGEL